MDYFLNMTHEKLEKNTLDECISNNLNHPPEKKCNVKWGKFLNNNNTIPVTKQNEKHNIPIEYEAYYLANLFSREECNDLITASEDTNECGYGTTDYPKQYRGNLRLIITDYSLTNIVWERVKSFVPPTVTLHGFQWEAIGLNECWRLSKYNPGDRFQGHCDANFVRNDIEMSMFTLNTYMNDVGDINEDAGGRTRFYKSNCRDIEFQCLPRAGDCILFRQPPGTQYYHDGEELISGVKYLFRSDVMYRKI